MFTRIAMEFKDTSSYTFWVSYYSHMVSEKLSFSFNTFLNILWIYFGNALRWITDTFFKSIFQVAFVLDLWLQSSSLLL